jgi:hypothetical protein
LLIKNALRLQADQSEMLLLFSVKKSKMIPGLLPANYLLFTGMDCSMRMGQSQTSGKGLINL